MKTFVAIVGLLAATATARADIDQGPIVHPTNGSSYYLLTHSTWTQAEEEAVGLGGHLASIGSAAENEWVWETFGPVANGAFWIGFNDAEQEGSFVWSDGAPVTYTAWWIAGGQPSNDDGVEHFAEMNNYVWNDNQDSALLMGVVEVAPESPIDVRVDWSAAVTGAHGPGTLSGTFGVFHVTSPGQVFPLPAGAALVASASGFSGGFANSDYALVNDIGGLSIRFDSLDPVTTTLVSNAGAAHPSRYNVLSPCGEGFVCRAILSRYVVGGYDLVQAGRGYFFDGSYFETYSEGQPIYSYTPVPEPGALTSAVTCFAVLAWLTRDRRAAPRRRR